MNWHKNIELEQDWEEYPVFKIDFVLGDYNNPKALDDILDNCLEDGKINIILIINEILRGTIPEYY